MTFSTSPSPGVTLQGGGGGGSGGGTPGGSDTQIQFNDGGSFGGDAGLTFNKTTDVLTLGGSQVINGGTVNGTLLNMSQTWGGTGTYTGIKYDVTDSGPSNAASLLMDLQVGTSSRFSVGKTGSLKLGVSPTGTNQAGTNVTIAGSQGTGNAAGGSIIFQVAPAGSSGGTAQNALATALTIGSNARDITIAPTRTDYGTIGSGTDGYRSIVLVGSADNGIAAVRNTGSVEGVVVRNTSVIGWLNSANVGSASIDSNAVLLARDAANTLALRNGANAQAFRIYNTYTDATTFERANIFWDSNVLKIGTEKGSVGGTARALEFQTDGTTRLTIASTGAITTSGNFTFGNDAILSGAAAAVISWGSNYPLIGRMTTEFMLFAPNSIVGHQVGISSGTNATSLFVHGSYTNSTNYQRMTVKTLRESSGALSGATYVTTIAIPAYANLIGVTTRVTTAVTGATTYDVGDGSDVDLWGAAIGVALGSQSRTADFTAVAAVGAAATSRTVTLTANGSNFTGGVVEICLHYLTTEAD